MSEEKTEANDQSADVVKREDYNKITELANSRAVEIEELKKKIETKTEEKKIETEKNEWQKHNEEMKKQIEELKSKVERKEQNTPRKGIVQTPGEVKIDEDPIDLLKKIIPDRKLNPEQFGSRMSRYGHYKLASTKAYSDEQLGMGLSLHASAQHVTPGLLPREARASKADLILKQ